jgi:hypothetical protein
MMSVSCEPCKPLDSNISLTNDQLLGVANALEELLGSKSYKSFLANVK